MDINELKNTADQCLRDGQLSKALDAYTQLCDLSPRSVHAWHMRAAIHGMLGQFPNTVHCCEKALSINPNAAAVYANYATALLELKHYEQAVQAFQKAIKLNPADVGSLGKLGAFHRTTGNLSDAETCFRRVIETAPDSVDAWSNLAHILKEKGELEASISVCEKALATIPIDRTILTTLLEGYFLVGDTDKAHQRIVSSIPLIENLTTPLYRICRRLHDNRQHAETINAIQTILRVFPEEQRFKLILADCQIQQDACLDAIATLATLDKPLSCKGNLLLAEAYNKTNTPDKAETQLLTAIDNYPDEEAPFALLARNFVKSGKYGKAASLLAKFLERHPDSHRILAELGNIKELEGNHIAAEQLYKQAISVQPEYAIAHSKLGALYQNRQRYDLAQKCFEQALHCDPDMLAARCSLAYLSCTRGEYSKALDYYDMVLESDHDFERAITGKAIVLERLGELEDSLELVEPLVQRGSENIHTVLAYAHACSVANKEATAATLLERALDRPGILPGDRMHACFMLGKLFDRLEQFDRAFANYQRGNELNLFPFDRNAHQQLVDATIAVFSPGNMKTFPRSSNQTDKLLFIVGMPRSGTTLTEQILASHPDVFGAGELSHIRDIAGAIPGVIGSQRPFPLDMPGISQEILDQFSSEHIKKLQSMTDGQTFITDKMPSNFMFLGLIELLFPNARILHCVRDPIDTCLSCYFQNFSSGQYFSYNQSDLVFYYQQYQRLMTHWKSTLSIPIMDVRYEELVNNQEATSRKMLKFSGLEWHAGCLDFHKSKRQIRTASYGQVRKPVYKSSVERWKNYERHLSQLKEGLCR